MARPETITQALQQAEYGAISADEALAALYCGVEQRIAHARDAQALRRAANRRAAAYWRGHIPGADGVFWAPNLWDARRALSVAEAHPRGPDHAIRWRARMRDDKVVGTLTCVGVEIDDVPIEEQAARLDELAALTGMDPALVVHSGGKSLHAFWAIRERRADGEDLEAWRRAVDLAIALLGADPACRNHGRAWRAPTARHRTRTQTTVWAEPVAYDLDELLAALERVAEDRGVAIVEPEAIATGRARRIASGANYARGELPGDTPVTAQDGRTWTLDEWPDHIDEDEHLRCWAPTEAGTVRSTGERRDQPGATLRVDEATGRAVVACHIEQILYLPERPRDPALERPVMPPDEMPYLGHVELDQRVVVLRTDTGTGKTQTLAEQLSPSRTGRARVTVSPRVAISRDVARRYGALCYLDVEGDIRLDHERDVVVTLNSVGRVYAPPGTGPLTLVLEESEQLAAALLGGTIPQTPQGTTDTALDVLQTLVELAQSAERIICADAFAGEATEALLDVLAPDEPRQLVTLGRKRPAPVTAWGERLDLLTALRAQLALGKRAIVASASKQAAEDLARAARDAGYRVACYTSDTDQSGRQDLDDVERWWSREHVDLVIYSPAISSGVSYDPSDDAERFDIAVLLAPLVDGVDWTTCAQMLDRARQPREVWVWVPEVEEPSAVPTRQTLAERKRAAWRAGVQAYAAAHGWDVELPEPQGGTVEPGLLAVALATEHARAVRQADRRSDLLRYLRVRGAPITERVGSDVSAQTKAELREARRRRLKEYGQRVEDAITPSPAELRDLQSRGAWTDEDAATLRRVELLERYGAVDAELASSDYSDTVWRQTRALVRAGLVADGHTKAAAERDIAAASYGSRAAARAQAARSVADVILLRVMLGEELTARLLAPVRAPARSEQGRPLLCEPLPAEAGEPAASWLPELWDADELAREYRYQLRRHGVSARLAPVSPTALAEAPQRWVGRALNRLGLATIRTVERVEEDGRKIRRRARYCIDLDRWSERCALAQRRAVSARGYPVRHVWDGALISSRHGAVRVDDYTCETVADFCHTSDPLIERETRMCDRPPPDWRSEAESLEAEGVW